MPRSHLTPNLTPLAAHPPVSGEEAEEEDAEATEAAQKLKIKSAHDLLEDDRLAKEPVVDIDLDRWVGGWQAGR